jgi:acyl carrier protein
MEPSSAYEAGQAAGKIAVYVVIGLAALGGGIFFIIALIKAITKKTKGWIIGAVVSALLAMFGVVGLIGMAANSIAKLAKTASEKKKTVASKDGRIRLEVPATWREMPDLHEDAQVQAGNALLDQYVMVLEDLKSDYTGSLQQFDALIIGQMKEKMVDCEVSEPEARPIGSYPALHRRLTGTVDTIKVVYHIALVETDAGFYQIMRWTTPSRESSVQTVFREIADSFTSNDGPPGPKPPRLATNASAHERVVLIVTEQLGIDAKTVKSDSRFIEDLGADSLDTVELVMAAEEEFEVSIPDEVAEKLRTVGDLVNWLEKPPVEVE